MKFAYLWVLDVSDGPRHVGPGALLSDKKQSLDWCKQQLCTQSMRFPTCTPRLLHRLSARTSQQLSTGRSQMVVRGL